ncbi:conserved hypothetical protein [Rubrivivax sp. A210]|uniref:DUF3422 family protein n=1 Tax=Rubrivivax sp. A210 TaxID=2772301 RepID=UPI0019195D7F|nr:DUF3422 domain-containing protein [Rubrivivax sp. A210]CAD5374880.1 conserved hypothetical protein [Rubrivivax sp. A210]
MSLLPHDHPERFALAEEVHARPPEPMPMPARATYLALLVDVDEREHEAAHLARLCERYAVAGPARDATHFSARLGGLRLKWERHGEFSSWTLVAPGEERTPFAEPAASLLPEGWLRGLPGLTLMSAHATLVEAPAQLPDDAELARHFEDHLVVGAETADGDAQVYTDFRIHGDGCSRFLLLGRRGLQPRAAGRLVQRLFEIEAYRMMALLALPIARRQAPRIVAIEKALATLTDGIARDEGADEALLHDLTRLAAEVESGLAASQFRFGACRAYAELVRTRIAELRETRIAGLSTIGGFMGRRFEPAVATVLTVSSRLHDLSERVAQASALLSTRVDIARERQNQALLASMNRRARLQLRLQQTVEGLSVAAIAYYLVGLVGYVAKGVKAGGLKLDPELTMGLSVPLVAGLVYLSLRRARRHFVEEAD